MKMLKINLILLSLLLLSFPVYAFESELTLGEINSIVATETTTLALRKSPSKESPIIIKFKIKKGDIIAFDETRVRTIKEGKIKRQYMDGLFHGRSFGGINYLTTDMYYSDKYKWKDYPIHKGDAIEELQYRAEGECLIKWQDETLEVESCPWYGNDANYVYVSKPIVEWWIRFTNNQKSLGWLLVVDRNLLVLPLVTN